MFLRGALLTEWWFPHNAFIYRLCPPAWLPCASLVLLHWLKTCPHYLYIHVINSSLFWTVFCRSFLPRKMCGRIKIRSTNLWNFPFKSWRLIPFLWDGVSGEQIWCAFGEQATSTLAFCSPWEVILPCYKQLQGGVPWLRMEVSSYQWGKRAVCLQWSKGVWCSGQHLHLQSFEIS